MKVAKLCDTNQKALGLVIAVIMAMLLVGQLSAQPPLGAPNEVWVKVPDTVYIGQEIEIQVHMANAEGDLHAFATSFLLYSPDSSQWDWVVQPDSEWNFQGGINFLTYVRGYRLWDYFNLRFGEWGPVDSQSAAFQTSAGSLTGPWAPAGPLGLAYMMHIRPTKTGTICLDSTWFHTADDQWIYYHDGSDPEWNGPFCFTVAEPPLGDIDCDGAGNLADAVYIINWIFKGGPDPCR